MNLPFSYTESPDGHLRVEGIIQRAFDSHGIDGKLYTPPELEKLSQYIIDTPALAEHGEDPTCKNNSIGKVHQSKIVGRDLHIVSVVPPPPETPAQIYDYVRNNLRTGKWKAYSIGWLAANDRRTNQPIHDTRLPIEVSFCAEPYFPYARFTRVSASAKHSHEPSGAVLTHQTRVSNQSASMEKSFVLSLLQASNPEFKEEELDNVAPEDYQKLIAAQTKRAVEERNQMKAQLENVTKTTLSKRATKAQQLYEQVKGLAPEIHAAEWEAFVTKDLPNSERWGTLQTVLKRVADDQIRLDTLSATAPQTVAMTAAKRAKPTIEPQVNSQAERDQLTEILDRAWAKYQH
jgi:hypothetical protein